MAPRVHDRLSAHPGLSPPLVYLLGVLGLVVFGLLMLYSASYIVAQEKWGDGLGFVKKQALFALMGATGLLVFLRVPPDWIGRFSRWLLALAGLMLVAVWIPGVGARVGGAQRWIRLAGFQFQPAEFAKFAVILYAAKALAQKKGLGWNLLAVVPVLGLLLLQPDFGSTVMVSSVLLILFFVSGISGFWLSVGIGTGAAASAALILGSAYRRARLLSYLNPWQDPSGKGFQILQSLVGLNQGGVFGVGLGGSKEKLFFLPEAHNDFIFAVIGEELGWLGVLGVICITLLMIYSGLKIAWEAHTRQRDLFQVYAAIGITLLIGFQSLLNMAVVMGLVPTKGLALPFISYGGSALVMDLCAVGILLSIARRQSRE